MKHANGILNKGNKDIGQIYLLEHSMVGNMLGFGGLLTGLAFGIHTWGKLPEKEGGTCSFMAPRREMKPETWGNPILCDSPMVCKIVRRKTVLHNLLQSQLSPI